MNLVILISFVVGVASIEQVYDTCNMISKFMTVRGFEYNQSFSQTVDSLTLCNTGPTCCNTEVEDKFYNEVNASFKRTSFSKTPYIGQLTEGRDKIDEYMTEVLTLASRANNRTKELVTAFLDMSDNELKGIDTMQYPIAVLLDVAESHGVTDLLDSVECKAQMMELLVDLGELQKNGLTLARLLYLAIPEGINVLEEMQYQSFSVPCVRELVKSHRCNLCLDSTNVQPCRDYCLAVASTCYDHLKDVSETWEEYAQLTATVLDSIDTFAKVYQDGLAQTIQQIRTKMKDSDISDMCGFNVATNLARHKRSDPESKVRVALFDGGFMEGMLGNLDELQCAMTSQTGDRCWNGTGVGAYTGPRELPIDDSFGEQSVTDSLKEQLAALNEFNKDFKAVKSIEINKIAEDVDRYMIYTEEPEFVRNNNSAVAKSILLPIVIFFVSWLLH